MIDQCTEELNDITQLAAGMQKACRPNTKTVHSWMTNGVNGVRLECVRVGRRLYSSREALDRFFAGIAEAADRTREERRAAKLAAKRSTEETTEVATS